MQRVIHQRALNNYTALGKLDVQFWPGPFIDTPYDNLGLTNEFSPRYPSPPLQFNFFNGFSHSALFQICPKLYSNLSPNWFCLLKLAYALIH